MKMSCRALLEKQYARFFQKKQIDILGKNLCIVLSILAEQSYHICLP
jgi:hypothetical protein